MEAKTEQKPWSVVLVALLWIGCTAATAIAKTYYGNPGENIPASFTTLAKKLRFFVCFVLVFALVVGTSPVASAQIIEPVIRGGTSANPPPVVAPNPLGEDELCFVDRTHRYNSIPIDLLGAEYVMVANNDKTQPDYSLQVTLNPIICGAGYVQLYLFLDNRLGHYNFSGHDPFLNPDLLAAGMEWVYSLDFVDTGQNIGIDENGDGFIDQWSSVYILNWLYLMDLGDYTITLLQQNDLTNPGDRNMYSVAALYYYPPNPYPCCPNPYDGSVDVSVDTILTWTQGRYAAQDEVYFGTDPQALPLVTTILPPGTPQYDPGDPNIIASTTYYWQVVETDANGIEHPVPVWSFTTVSGKTQVDYPPDGAIIVGEEYMGNIYTRLDYVPGPTTVKWTAYFHEDYEKVLNRHKDAKLGPPPYPQMPTRYYVGIDLPGLPYIKSLERGKHYYWTVDGTDHKGNIFYGDVWTFGVQGLKAFAPTPRDGAKNVDPNVLLSWLPGYVPTGSSLEHDVYFGTNFDDVNNAFYNSGHGDQPPELLGTVTEPNILVTDLKFNTKYYWRVDEVADRLPPPIYGGIYSKGDVWCFTTTLPDLNNDGSIDFLDYAIFANDWPKTGPGLRGDIYKDNKVDYNDLGILVRSWLCGWNERLEDDTEDSYSCDGSFDVTHPCINAVDEDWNTYALPADPGAASYIYENYMIPPTTAMVDFTIKYKQTAPVTPGLCSNVTDYWNGSTWKELNCTALTNQISTLTVEIPDDALRASTLKLRTRIWKGTGLIGSGSGMYYEGKVIWFVF